MLATGPSSASRPIAKEWIRMPASPARRAASITSRTLSARWTGPYGSVGCPSVKKKMTFCVAGSAVDFAPGPPSSSRVA
jgi:hypothetical protein